MMFTRERLNFLYLFILTVPACIENQYFQDEYNFAIKDFEYSIDDIEEFEVYSSRFRRKVPSTPCYVVIKDDRVIILRSRKTNLTKEEILVKGILKKHKSGKWIIAASEKDIYAEKLGSCSGGPTVIDLKHKIIEWC